MFGKRKREADMDAKSEAAVAAKKKPSTLTKEERAAIARRIAEIKKVKNDPSSAQNTIQYRQMYKDGICQVEKGCFPKPFSFSMQTISLQTLRNRILFSQNIATY